MSRYVASALAGLCIFAGCVDPQPTLGSTEQASTSSGHTAASDWAYEHSCAWQFTNQVGGLPAETVAERYGLDPDCGTTLSSRTITLPSGNTRSLGDCMNSWPPDPTWTAPLNSVNSALAMCTNWDHFSNNGFGLESNADMVGALENAAASAAQQGDNQNALRYGFDACHYAVDRNQCGHSFGNMVCDPNAQVITQECQDFVHNFAWVGTQYGGIDTNLLASGCAYLGLANVYATAERYIRHHNPGLVLDNPAWVNQCPDACPGGDSDGPQSDACQLGGTSSDTIACQNAVQQTCNNLCTPKSCADLGNPTSLVLQCGVEICCNDAACGPGWHCNDQQRCEQVCTAILPQCGPYTDSCGTQKYQYCPSGSTCVGDVCQPDCSANPPACGPYTDSCGHAYPGNGCVDGFTCTNGTCTQVCSAIRPQCGPYTDSCGHALDAGGCGGNARCVDGSCQACTANVPQCGPYTDSCGNPFAGAGCSDGFTCQSGSCVQVCSAIRPQCGPYSDSCGNWFDAGGCGGGATCVGGACQACTANPPQCGPYADSCGNNYPGNACGDGYTCDGGSCVQVCTAVRPECGPYSDTCGNALDAGGCPSGFECAGGSCAACSANPPECGPYSDSCGNYFSGGSCPGGSQCVGGACQQTQCTANPPECGGYTDSCGNYFSGNSCPSGFQCNGGACEQVQSCVAYPPECGGYTDSCGNYFSGSSCPSGYECDGGACQQVQSCIAYPPECGGYSDTCGNYYYAGDCPPDYGCYGGTCEYEGGGGGGGGGGGSDCWWDEECEDEMLGD